jgi:hypothetical protein
MRMISSHHITCIHAFSLVVYERTTCPLKKIEMNRSKEQRGSMESMKQPRCPCSTYFDVVEMNLLVECCKADAYVAFVRCFLSRTMRRRSNPLNRLRLTWANNRASHFSEYDKCIRRSRYEHCCTTHRS